VNFGDAVLQLIVGLKLFGFTAYKPVVEDSANWKDATQKEDSKYIKAWFKNTVMTSYYNL
jgi:hypothetical protein